MANQSTIKIFFDTNILHTNQAHLLLPAKVVDYIKDHRKIESVDIKWYVPRMVIEERRHQMKISAELLMPKMHDFERLIGHNLCINSEILDDRISTKINKAVEEHGLEIIELNSSDVDLDDVIERSAQRKPPFEQSGDKEKGFRDAIIANSFLQEMARSPTTPRVCRLVFVSGDERLRDYINEKKAGNTNVRLLESLDDLKSMINAIASEVTEEFLSQITDSAKRVFYDFDTSNGLYKTENIYEKINEQYKNELKSVVATTPSLKHEFTSVVIADQTFIEKSGQIVHWTTEVLFRFKIKETASSAVVFGVKNPTLLGAGIQEPNTIATGKTRFLVHWQHQISTKGKISRPKINKIEFVEHEIDDEKEGLFSSALSS